MTKLVEEIAGYVAGQTKTISPRLSSTNFRDIKRSLLINLCDIIILTTSTVVRCIKQNHLTGPNLSGGFFHRSRPATLLEKAN
ncbi:TPA: hypothetical protein ACGOV9_002288 [Streptococcus suis]